jgi:hypothetical protein
MRFTITVDYDLDSGEDEGGVCRAFRDILLEQEGVLSVDAAITPEPHRSLEFTVQSVKENQGHWAEGVSDSAIAAGIEAFFESSSARREMDFLYEAFDTTCATILDLARDADVS